MYRPNTIGTPWIHTPDVLNNTTSFTITTAAANAALTGNVINSAAGGNFTRSPMRWNGAARTIPANNKWSIVQTFTVTAPVNGDTVGVELMAGLTINMPGTAQVIPFVIELSNTPAATWATWLNTGVSPTWLGPPMPYSQADATTKYRYYSYKEQVLLRDSSALGAVAGLYAHGFAIFETAGAAITFDGLEMIASVRQLMDQQGVAYQNTRR